MSRTVLEKPTFLMAYLLKFQKLRIRGACTKEIVISELRKSEHLVLWSVPFCTEDRSRDESPPALVSGICAQHLLLVTVRVWPGPGDCGPRIQDVRIDSANWTRPCRQRTALLISVANRLPHTMQTRAQNPGRADTLRTNQPQPIKRRFTPGKFAPTWNRMSRRPKTLTHHSNETDIPAISTWQSVVPRSYVPR